MCAVNTDDFISCDGNRSVRSAFESLSSDLRLALTSFDFQVPIFQLNFEHSHKP